MSLRNPQSPRHVLGIVGLVMLFYLALFAVMSLLDFPFSLPLLIMFLILIGVPLGVVAVGIVHGVVLWRRRRDPAYRKPPSVYVSTFVATTFLCCAMLVANFDSWVEQGAAERAAVLGELLPDEMPEPERRETVDEIERFWLLYLRELKQRNAEEIAQMSDEMGEAVELALAAYEWGTLSVTQVTELRAAVGKVLERRSPNAPRAGPRPAESGNGS